MAVYGYVRVSTKGQVPGTSLAEQEQQIRERYPAAIIVQEAASGAHERQQFNSLRASLKPGDTLVVCKMDRFCRSARQGLEYVDALRQKGVAIHILNMGLLDDTPMGRLIATMLLAFAEFERAQIIERTQSGKVAAREKTDFRDGRPPKFATVYKGNIIKNLIMDCQSYTKYRPNETTGGIFVSWRRKEELPTGA